MKHKQMTLNTDRQKTPELLSWVNDSCRLECRLTLNTFMCVKQLAMVLES